MIYSNPPITTAFAQGDLLLDCPLVAIPRDVSTFEPSNPIDFKRKTVVVLTQSCDLAQGKSDRVLVSVIHRAQDLVDIGVVKTQTIRDQIRLGKVFGWYFLPDGRPAITLDESIVDLREI